MHVRTAAVVVLGVALAGCGGGAGPEPSRADKVKPELPRVSVEVKGMT